MNAKLDLFTDAHHVATCLVNREMSLFIIQNVTQFLFTVLLEKIILFKLNYIKESVILCILVNKHVCADEHGHAHPDEHRHFTSSSDHWSDEHGHLFNCP